MKTIVIAFFVCASSIANAQFQNVTIYGNGSSIVDAAGITGNGVIGSLLGPTHDLVDRAVAQKYTSTNGALYPNPTRGLITISLPTTAGTLRISVFDALARPQNITRFRIADAKVVEIDLSGLVKGAYTVIAYTSTGNFTYKSILQ